MCCAKPLDASLRIVQSIEKSQLSVKDKRKCRLERIESLTDSFVSVERCSKLLGNLKLKAETETIPVISRPWRNQREQQQPKPKKTSSKNNQNTILKWMHTGARHRMCENRLSAANNIDYFQKPLVELKQNAIDSDLDLDFDCN